MRVRVDPERRAGAAARLTELREPNSERFVMVEPSLAGWDCPSVLWLRPAYRLIAP